MLEGEDIICLYCEKWDTPLVTSKHHIMRRLAQHNRVLYVEYPFHPFVFLKHPSDFVQNVRRWCRGVREVEPNLFVCSTFSPFPYHRFSRLTSSLRLNRANQRWVFFMLRPVLQKLGLKRPILWFYFPHAVEVLEEFAPKLVLFHVVDEFAALTGMPETFRELSRKLLERADLVVTPVRHLQDSLCVHSHGRKVFYVPHAADLELFSGAQDSGLEPLPEVASLPAPRLGYYGAIHKLDMGLIRQIAESRPEWTLVFVGPTSGVQGADVSSLSTIPNVHFIGSRPQNVLPAFLRAIDVAIMPFLINELTWNMSPIKTYEFLAAGKPVVSVDLPEIRALAPNVSIARDGRDFCELVEQALKQDGPERVRERIRLMAGQSWDARVSQLEKLICDKLSPMGFANKFNQDGGAVE